MYARGKILLEFQKLESNIISRADFPLSFRVVITFDSCSPRPCFEPRKENKPYFLANYLTRFPSRNLSIDSHKVEDYNNFNFCAGFRHVYQKRSPTMEPP